MSTSSTNKSGQSQPVTVLLVEDNASVRVLATRALESRGYRVLSCRQAGEALRVFAGEHIDLLLTDVVMPGLDGVGLARKLLATRPALKVLLMSGYPRGALPATDGLGPCASFLGKPFRASELVRTVGLSLRSQA